MDIVKITGDIISLDEIAKSVADPKAGAISTFSGTTRDNFEGMRYFQSTLGSSC
jgi:molybdopterin synthase catalytic subunit